MTTFSEICPDCGGRRAIHYGQDIDSGKLVWFASIHCPRCRAAIEFDDDGFPPAAVRDALVREEGYWTLHIDAEQPIVQVLKVLRAALCLSLAEVATLRARVPGVVQTGTYVEMTWLQALLAAQGVMSHVRLLEDH